MENNIQDLLASLDTDASKETRLNDSFSLQQRLSGTVLEQEVELSALSLHELYDMATGLRACSEYQLYRSRAILDNLLNRRSRR